MDFKIRNELATLWASLKNDALPSIVVFLVALPLCMGIAIASGVPVAAGLITGIVGGLVVGVLAGAPLQVSGPAAGLTVIVYDIVQRYGLETLGVLVLMAGILQIVAGLLRLGQWFRAVSPAVIRGMLAGIGVLIFASQFHVMVDDSPRKTAADNLLAIPDAIRKGLPLPEASTAADRQLRTTLLKQVGALHQDQAALSKEVAANVPVEAGESLGAEASSLTAIEHTALMAAQQQITDQLRKVIEPMEDDAPSVRNKEKVVRAAELALTDSEAALAALGKMDVTKWQVTQTSAATALENLTTQLKSHQWAAKIGILTIVVLLAWQAFKPKALRALPAPLVAIVVAVGVAAVWSLPVLYVEVPSNLADTIQMPSWSTFAAFGFIELLQAAIAMALIASAETLLCATAVDQMHSGPRTKYDRELWAQGIGNSICGFFGALPMTGVIVRSTANVQAGGRTRWSAVLHGFWLLLFVATLPFLLRSIPVAALAAILVYTGYKLVNLKQVKELRKYGWGEVVIYFATLIGIVATDLLTGVIIGIALSAAKLLYTFSHLSAELTTDAASNRSVLSLTGTATFLRLPVLAAKLEEVPGNAELHVDFQHLEYVDHACLDLLMNWAEQHRVTGGTLVLDWDSFHAQFRGETLARKRAVA